ncbi:MAG: ImmA/IrrE family metallo-endopeptidase [Pirellulales bacterium]|nr:ImmA/IrrE family metallo-endopeptidase [Pirellulales bacterium]
MPTIAIKPELIRWAIDRSGLPVDELAQRFTKLEQWVTGEKQPTFRQLEDFAKKTMTPFGFLFLDEPPQEQLPIPDFRTVGDTPIDRPSPNLIETIHTMQRRQTWMRDYLIEEGNESLTFVGSGKGANDIVGLARQVRRTLNLDVDWAERLATWDEALTTLRRAIERIGILVFSNSVVGLNNRRNLDPEEFRGFVLCDSHAPLIFLNSADSKSAQMFTLAHELTHVWLGTDGLFNLVRMMPSNKGAEQFCNRVAAEFLVPGDKLKERWDEASEIDTPFDVIARQFKISPLVAARRALDLRLIDQSAFFRFYEQYRESWLQRKDERRREASGGNFYRTIRSRLSRRFSSAVVRAVREGRILYHDAYRLTDLKGETFNRYARLVLGRDTE